MSSCDFSGGYISGMFGKIGGVGLIVGHPFDTVKVVQQTQGLSAGQSIKLICQQSGYRGLFRGLGFPLLGNGGINSLFFGVYGYVLQKISQNEFKWYSVEDEIKTLNQSQAATKKLTNFDFFLAGCIGGLAAVSLACPIDIVKIRLQTHREEKTSTGKRMGPMRCLYDILVKEGIKGPFRGVMPMVYRDVPSAGVYMLVYEACSKKIKEWNTTNDDTWSAIGYFFAGGLAGLLSWWTVIPIDTVKSIIQSDDPVNPKYSTKLIPCTKQVIKQHGIRRLFTGFWAISLRGFTVNGATFLSFEFLLNFCTRLRSGNSS